VSGRVPHRQLPDQPGEQRAHGGVAVDAVDRDLDGCVQLFRQFSARTSSSPTSQTFRPCGSTDPWN
jgi:hypothetical protein